MELLVELACFAFLFFQRGQQETAGQATPPNDKQQVTCLLTGQAKWMFLPTHAASFALD